MSSLDEIRAVFGRCSTLAAAIVAGLRLTPAWEVVDVVIQDEFTHDVVMTAAAGGPAIVLDCT